MTKGGEDIKELGGHIVTVPSSLRLVLCLCELELSQGLVTNTLVDATAFRSCIQEVSRPVLNSVQVLAIPFYHKPKASVLVELCLQPNSVLHPTSVQASSASQNSSSPQPQHS